MLAVILAGLCIVSGVMAVDPRPCCMPSKFSGTLISLEGKLVLGQTVPSIVDSYMYMDYDISGQEFLEIRFMGQNTTKRSSKITLYHNYPQGKRYVVQENGNCLVGDLDPNSQLPNCIPDSFAYMGSYDIGSHSNSIKTHVFSGFLPGQGQVQFDFHVTATDCVPLFELHHGTGPSGKKYLISNWIYSNMIWNQNKVGVFDLPAACDHAMPIPTPRKRDVIDVDDTSLPFILRSLQ